MVTNGTHPHAWKCLAISGTRRRLEKTRFTRCFYFWQPQRRISKARSTLKTHWQRRQIRLQHSNPNLVHNVNLRAVYGTNEHHGSEYDWEELFQKTDLPMTEAGNGVPAPPLIAVSRKSSSKHAAMVFCIH